MSTTREEIVKLFKCSVDVCTEVVLSLVNDRLSGNSGSLQAYLNDDNTKHRLYHSCDKFRNPCCLCPPAGCHVSKVCKMEWWIFNKVYQNTNNEKEGHGEIRKGTVLTSCVCKYEAKAILVNDLDLTVAAFFLKDSRKLSPKEQGALNTITNTRNNICHHPAQSSTSSPSDMWTSIENAVVELVDTKYQKSFRNHISTIRNERMSDEVIVKMEHKINEMHNMITSITSRVEELPKGSAIEMHTERVVNRVKIEIQEMFDQNNRELINFFLNDGKNKGNVNDTTDDFPKKCLMEDCKVILNCPKSMRRHIEYDHNYLRRCSTSTVSHSIKPNMRMINNETGTKSRKPIVAKLKVTGKNLNDDLAVKNINSSISRGKKTNKKNWIPLSAKKECVLMDMIASPDIFADEESLSSSIRDVIGMVLKAGEVDMSKEDMFNYTLTFTSQLSKGERKMLENLIRNNKPGYFDESECERFDQFCESPNPDVGVKTISNDNSKVEEDAKRTVKPTVLKISKHRATGSLNKPNDNSVKTDVQNTFIQQTLKEANQRKEIDLFKSTDEWSANRINTITKLKHIEDRLDEAAQKIGHIKQGRNVSLTVTLVAGISGGYALCLAGGVSSLGFTVWEQYVEEIALANAQKSIEMDKIETSYLMADVNYKSKEGSLKEQHFAKNILKTFPNAILLFEYTFIDFLKRLFGTKSALVLSTKERISKLREDLENEEKQMQKQKKEARSKRFNKKRKSWDVK